MTTEGDMKRELLLMLMASAMWMSGCAGRMKSDLLLARIREQSVQLAESQQEIAKTRAELKRAHLQTEQLQWELANSGLNTGEGNFASRTVSQLKIHSMSSGGLNQDDQPGDDVVVVQFVPLDSSNEVVRAAGDLEIALFDPQMPESVRELGAWRFPAEECEKHWTRGITSSGFQFNLPLDQSPRHSNLIVHLKYRTSDDRQLQVQQVVKVALRPNDVGTETAQFPRKRQNPAPVPSVDDWDQFLEPVGDVESDLNENDPSTQPPDRSTPVPVKSGRAILHSSNWTDATIPQLR